MQKLFVLFFLTMSIIGIFSYIQVKKTVFSPIKTKELKNFNTYGMLNIYSKKRPSLEPKAKKILTYINTYLNIELDGWSFIFSWHKNSDTSCLPSIQSLKDRMKQGNNLGTILFKFILLNSENFAFSPTWWESLSKDKQKEISQAITNMEQPTLAIRQHYLYNGLENISNWNFETINDNLTTVSKL